jgi:ketosteroid isomerase-like protein
MKTAAQAHDVDAHLAFYIHSPTLLFVINGEAIRGWEALRQKQREWWQNGKSDVVYQLVDSVDYRMPAPGLVIQTYFLASRRTNAGGSTRESRLGVTALWQKRAEGWRIIYAHESSVTR